MKRHIRKRLAFWLRTRTGMVAYGTVFFGGAFGFTGFLVFPAVFQLPFPGILIPIVAFALVGACWGEAVWQFWERLPWSMKRYRGPD